MPSTIVLNSADLRNLGNGNNFYVYDFPTSVNFPNHEIAVQSITMYYSWQNINVTPLNNNVFTYTWTVGVTKTTYTITIPPGLYNISDINNYCQSVMISNGHYLVTSTGQFVYYFELLVNTSAYAIQLNTFSVPTTLPTGYSAPSNFAGYPTTTCNPIVTFPANFNKIVGYAAGFASGAGSGSTLSYLSSTAPQVQPNPNLFFSVTNVNNNYGSPSNIIYSLSPTVALGEQIIEKPNEYAWNPLMPGTHQSIRLQILDTNYQPINLLDPTAVIVLLIKDKKEAGLKELLSGK